MWSRFWKIKDVEMNEIAEWSIGVFDSGVGGLTVVKEISRYLPKERIIYLGDTARVPYGSRSPETIVRYSRDNARFLMERGIKLLVVACNTASSVALDYLKKILPIQVVGVVEPGARRALEITRSGRIGVIGTEATIKSRSYEKAITKLDGKAQVFAKPCPLFVPLVEEGMIENSITYSVAEYYLKDLKSKRIDTLVLGCTHYPVLKRVIQDVMGGSVTLVDSAEEVAKVVTSLLQKNGLNSRNKKGSIKYYVTDAPEKFKKLGRIFLTKNLSEVEKVEL